MNNDRIEGNWKQLKGKVKEQWGKLTDSDLDIIAGKRDQLLGRIQERMGVTKDIAGWVLGAAYVDTNAKGSCNPGNPGFYCFSNDFPSPAVGTPGIKYKDAGKATVVLSVSKTF